MAGMRGPGTDRQRLKFGAARRPAPQHNRAAFVAYATPDEKLRGRDTCACFSESSLAAR
jgi:hypothetical protein